MAGAPQGRANTHAHMFSHTHILYSVPMQADLKAQEAKGIKQECEAILADALPALNAAVAALNTIKAADIRLVQVSVCVRERWRGQEAIPILPWMHTALGTIEAAGIWLAQVGPKGDALQGILSLGRCKREQGEEQSFGVAACTSRE